MVSTEKLIYRQFRDHEDLLGASKTTILCIDALIASISELNCSKEAIKKQTDRLIKIIGESEPRIIPLIHLIESFKKEAEANKIFEKESSEEIKKAMIALLEKEKSVLGTNLEKLSQFGSSLITTDDKIVVHSASSGVVNSLLEAKKEGKNFSVLLLKQDFVKTKQIMKAFDKANIPFEVIPEHNLIHHIDDMTKVFLGATALTADEKIVMAVGTTGVVGVSHLHKIPIYLFANTLKFSCKKCREQRIHKKQEKRMHGAEIYSFTQYSHDIVQLKYIDHLISEQGEMSKEEIKKSLKESPC